MHKRLPTGMKVLCPMATLYCPQNNGISSQWKIYLWFFYPTKIFPVLGTTLLAGTLNLIVSWCGWFLFFVGAGYWL